MTWFRKIVHLALLSIMMVMISVASAAGQVITIYPNQIVDFSVEEEPAGSTYKWEIYCETDFGVNMAQIPGTCPDGEVVSGQGTKDAQIRFSKPGVYLVKIEVWDPVDCTNNMEFYKVEVEESLPEAELALDPDEICLNEPSKLIVTLTGEPLWGFTLQATDIDGNVDLFYYTNIDASENPYDIIVTPEKTTWYKVIEVTDNNGVQKDPSNEVKLTVHPLPVNSTIYIKE